MIISHPHQFIFIKTMKTASTSVEIALSKHCGPADVLTPISEEPLRSEPESRGPQNFRARPGYLLPDHDPALGGEGKVIFRRHMPAKMIRARTHAEVWDSYYKFAVERNPWDKVVSFYYFKFRNEPAKPEFTDFVASNRFRSLGMRRYEIDGRIAVDHVMRYENLEKEMELLTDRLDIPEVPRLPSAKSGIRPKDAQYRKMYDRCSRERIAELFAREIGTFGYEF